MFNKVLIANRGEIACRIIRTLRELNIKPVSIYSEADRDAPHAHLADESYCVGPAPAADSYLNQEKIFEICELAKVDAIHPGYGFLSENAGFAAEVEKRGMAFIGPTPSQIKSFGLKHEARALARTANVPITPSTELLESLDEAVKAASTIGYPIMLKSTAGGGGIGMRVCRDEQELNAAFDDVKKLAANNFSNSGVYLETFIEQARHIEVQIFGDGNGKILTLGERDCSLQRRNQKVVEEAPAPNLSQSMREQFYQWARLLGESINYRSAGTVEFLYDVKRDKAYFLEVNSRLQVEHGVTECITGIDLVEWMIRLAAGEPLRHCQSDIKLSGSAMEVRIYAEDPAHNFRPCTGQLTAISFPESVRIDSGIEQGQTITPFYDPMLAKVISFAETRDQARLKLLNSLNKSSIFGIQTNLDYLEQVIDWTVFKNEKMSTQALDYFIYQPKTIDVLKPGAQTSVQEWPGRLGYWDVGVPPSGPMDDFSFRLANKILGNAPGTTALEITFEGPVLKFNIETEIAFGGADFSIELDGQRLSLWTRYSIKPGQELRIGRTNNAGQRLYLAVKGGIDAPVFLGSRACFALGKFGGPTGVPLRLGDVLHLADPMPSTGAIHSNVNQLDKNLVPVISTNWTLHVLSGPHTAPDYFDQKDIETLYSTEYEVHYNSDRTGIRLVGPKPIWAREDGGEAGLHPSNIHDNAYAIGTLDFTGDMPILLGPDGPSLGGFVSPLTVCQADLWKLGQLKPGDKVNFVPITQQEALSRQKEQEELIDTLKIPVKSSFERLKEPESPILFQDLNRETSLTIRRSGDANILVEYGPETLDLGLRIRVEALLQEIKALDQEQMIDLTPGIRSLQLHFDSQNTEVSELIQAISDIDHRMGTLAHKKFKSRIVHLPLSWDDPSTQLATRKYQELVRPDAPWCPSNLEFIRRINGLKSIEEVKDIVFNASYFVLGLGDVYLGAPVATPLDPRHRLVTTKYNPARTWTPENAVGIGGAFMCIYGMEGPGGYQFVGRTIQVWNTHRQTDAFKEQKPWLLRFFDQVRFYPVTANELEEARQKFPVGQYPIKIEETEFDFSEYREFLKENENSIKAFKSKQTKAFEDERAHWAKLGIATNLSEQNAMQNEAVQSIPEGYMAVEAPMAGAIWTIDQPEGAIVEEGETILKQEAMKMEFPVPSPASGKVSEVLVVSGDIVQAGQTLAIIKLDV